jgi:hypothetical protein
MFLLFMCQITQGPFFADFLIIEINLNIFYSLNKYLLKLKLPKTRAFLLTLVSVFRFKCHKDTSINELRKIWNSFELYLF